jgi:hypothetical protein
MEPGVMEHYALPGGAPCSASIGAKFRDLRESREESPVSRRNFVSKLNFECEMQ